MKKEILFLILLLIFGRVSSNDLFSLNTNNQLNEGELVKIKNTKKVKILNSNFKFEKLKAIKFTPFSFDDFKIKPNEVVKLKNGKSISTQKFLEEVNEIEKRLNEWGYSLRGNRNEIILGELNFPYDLLEQQNKLLKLQSNKIVPDNMKITPCGIITDSELQAAIKSGTPQEPWPIKHTKDWSITFGDNNFGIEINSNFELSAEEKNQYLHGSTSSNFEMKIKILNEIITAINLQDRIFNKPFQNQITLYMLNKKAVDDNLTRAASKNYYKNLDWETGIEFFLGPFNVEGTFNLSGNVGVIKNFNPGNLTLEDKLIPYINLNLSGELNVGFEIVEAGIDGNIKFVNDTLTLFRKLELKNPEVNGGYFVYNAKANNKLLEALKGKIYAYLEIDYLIDSKKFIMVFYNNEEGLSLNNNIYFLNVNQPARRDKELYLEILRINGITNYTARNEKNNVTPVSFEVCVDAEGQSFKETIADLNDDGIIETPIKFKIPLLSSLSILIKISVKEKYKIGKFNFESLLDLVKGEMKDIEFCYNPIARKLYGSLEGQEEQEVLSTGDTNYFGERHHSIKFKLMPHMGFKSAPVKAR